MPGRHRPRARKSQIATRIGTVVRQRREAAGLTQERLAEKADLSKNYIGNVERAEQEVSITALIKIAAGLGVPASILLADAGY